MADSELFETEEGGEEVTLTIIDDGEPEVQEKPKRKKKEMTPEAKARLLENLAKGRAKQAERRKKAQETKKLKQQLKDQEEEAELEALRKKVKAKSKPAEAKVKTPVPDEVAISTEGKEGEEKNNINEDYLKKLKEKDDELNKLKSYISTAQKKAQEWKEAQTKKKSPAPQKSDSPTAQERKRPAQTVPKKPAYKYNYSTGKMEWS